MVKYIQNALARCKDESGVTLAEVIIAVGLISTSVAMVGPPMFSVIRANESWRQERSAIANWRQAAGSLSRDAVNAQTISLGDGSPSVDSISMTWVTEATHTVDYALASNLLLRTYDGSSGVVARRVSGVSFTRNGNLLTMELTMQDAVEPVEARAALRSLKE